MFLILDQPIQQSGERVSQDEMSGGRVSQDEMSGERVSQDEMITILVSGGMMTLTDAFVRVNRARGLELVSPGMICQICHHDIMSHPLNQTTSLPRRGPWS